MAEVTSRYHHGLVIREFREKRGMTQETLAERWRRPGHPDGEGVSQRYIWDIEHGMKHINDPEQLRHLASILDIPLWRFGLSEYDPFQPQALPGHGKRLFQETLDVVEQLISQTWSLRRAAHIVDADKGIRQLNRLFAYYHEHLSPPLYLEQRFQLLEIQIHRLNAATALENKRYDDAIAIYRQTLEEAKQLDNPAALAQALKGLGKELERKGEKKEAVSLLEEARDISLSGSKPLIAFVHSYLARVYASAGDSLRFERAVNTGLTIARSLNGYVDGIDFVYSWSPVSAMLSEKSWGYLNIGEPQKTLAMREELEREIILGQDERVYAWIPLDWACAHLMLGEVEAGIAAVQEFLVRVTAMQSPHAISQAFKYVKELEDAGYGDVQAVKEFREELMEVR